MKRKSIVPTLFGALGGALAVTALVICLTQRDAAPMLLRYPQEAEDCVSAMMTDLCSGNYREASQYLYGRPDLGIGPSGEDEAAALLWSAFTDSLHYTADEPCTATASGIAQTVTVTSLDMNGVLEAMEQKAPELLNRAISWAADMDDVYDENHEYRKDFVGDVMAQAAQAALEEAQTTEHTVTVNLLYDDHQWWVMPDQALLAAISGGILQ